MPKLYIDIETYSSLDLPTVGAHRYVESPHFMILMAAWAVDDGPVRLETDPEAIRRIPGLWDDDVLKVAHNAAFERICFSRFAGLPVGEYLDPDCYYDTQAAAALNGYPQKLEKLAKALKTTPKDTAGTRLISLFCKPNRAGKRTLPTDRPTEWEAFGRYCIQDVETLREIDRALPEISAAEREVYNADQRVNDTGIRVDLPMAHAAVEAGEENLVEQELRFRALTGVDNPRSIPQMTAWVAREGLTDTLPNMQAATLEAAAAGGALSPEHHEAVELRMEIALSAAAKYSAAIASTCSDSRFRGGFHYHGAHTGRWAGRRVQLHNLPRASLGDKDDSGRVVEGLNNAAIVDLLLGEGAEPYTLKALIRPMFTGPFCVVDYSAIEARVLAWLAGEQWALDAFASGRDIYVENAKRMSTPDHPMERSDGKIAELALGYNGGPKSLRAMGAEGDEDHLRVLVYQWRDAHPNTVDLWSRMDRAFRHGGKAGRLRVRWVGRDRHLVLPSGRSIVYHNVNPEETFVFVDDDGKRVKKTAIRFDNPAKYPGRSATYGGKLVENATQAVARDILAEALVRLVNTGYRVVGHVHDEVVVEAPASELDRITELMVEPPSWSAGLPLAGEGFTCDRYRKG